MKILFSLILICISITGMSQNMDNERLDSLLNDFAAEVDREGKSWSFRYNQGYMLMVTDENHNRMRVIMPIVEDNKVSKKQIISCLEANFHTALDVKHAFSNGYLWAVFIHPLKELSDDQFNDAVMQVYAASVNFGPTYTSTDLVFPSSNN